MKVISVSAGLDGPDTPEYVMDYVLYHQMCHILVGFDPLGTKHGDEYAELEAKYPQREAAESWLRTHNYYV